MSNSSWLHFLRYFGFQFASHPHSDFHPAFCSCFLLLLSGLLFWSAFNSTGPLF